MEFNSLPIYLTENNAGQARVTNNQLKFCQGFLHDDIVPYVNFTSDVRENPPSSFLRLMRPINTLKNIADDGSFESGMSLSLKFYVFLCVNYLDL